MHPAVLTAALVLGVLLCNVGTTYGNSAAFCTNYPKKSCGKGFEQLDAKRCVQLFWPKITFYEALGYCRRFGGKLASIHSDDQRKQVDCMVWRGRLTSKEIWIGADRPGHMKKGQKGKKEEYTFIDGSPMDYGYWSPLKRLTKGSERCVAANYAEGGTWGATWCSEKKHFLCTVDRSQM